MKTRYYFRKNGTDFFKWCRLVPRCKFKIKCSSYCSSSMLESNLVEYEEAKLILRQYKVLVSTLTEQERDLLKNYYVRGKFPPDNTGYLFREIYNNWLEIVFPHGKSRLQPLDKVKTANILKQLRLESGYNKEEVSGLIGISPASLRHYEEGKILVPLDVLFLMFQIYGVTIEKISLLYKNSKK